MRVRNPKPILTPAHATVARTGSRRTLVETVRDGLREQILSGSIKEGDKLPSEARLTESFGVSRTVVREAISSLRADGLVDPRQGAGVFVLTPAAHPVQPFQNIDIDRISHTIELLELRCAVEIEAAGLAAIRRSPAQEEELIQRNQAIDALIAAAHPTTDADFQLHLAIADATNNPRFREFLELMGRNVIPRAALQNDDGERTPEPYLAQISAEHAAIVDAISARDDLAARAAMRTHLTGSQQRYREILRRARA